MKKKGVKVEWTVVDDEEGWLASQNSTQNVTPAPGEMSTKLTNRKEAGIAALLVALIVLLVGGWSWQQQRLAVQTASELQTALAQDLPTLFSPSAKLQPSANGLAADTSAVGGDVGGHMDKYQRLGDRVMVQMTVAVPVEGKMLTYRETRFFQKQGDRWLRIAPDPKLMGPLQTLKLANFTIHYPAADADAVYEAAPKLEQLYSKLGSDLGLPVANATASYTIEVATQGPYSLRQGGDRQGVIVVPSPTLLSAPVEMTAGSLLYQSLVYPLARQVVSQVIDRPTVQENSVQRESTLDRRRLLTPALALWELWEDGGTLASGRAEVVRWLYAKAESSTTHQSVPENYELLCQIYHIWQILPWDVAIPLTCTDADKQTQTLDHYATLPMPVQAQLYPEQGRGMLDELFNNIGTSETLIEYVAATYGRDRLPVFIAALGEQKSLDSLIPDVFGVSPAEFKAGWQSYVTQRYHVK